MKHMNRAVIGLLILCGSLANAFTLSPNEKLVIATFGPQAVSDYDVFAKRFEAASASDADRKLALFHLVFMFEMGAFKVPDKLKELNQLPDQDIKAIVVDMEKQLQHSRLEPGRTQDQSMESFFVEFLSKQK